MNVARIHADTLNILYMYIVYTKTEGNIIKKNKKFKKKLHMFVYLLFLKNYSIVYFHTFL